MATPLRISTAPPSFALVGAYEMSHYCDIREITRWTSLRVVRDLPGDAGAIPLLTSAVGYLVTRAFGGVTETEIGALLGYENDLGEMLYLGIDHLGRHYLEPAANEALWGVANAARGLPGGNRLARAVGHH